MKMIVKTNMSMNEPNSSMSMVEKQKLLKRKHVSMEASRRSQPKIETEQTKMETEVMNYMIEMRSKNKRITRTILLCKAMEVYPDFKGGIGSTDFMSKILNWFYYGFIRRHNLSWCRIVGASRKLPHD